MQLIFMSITSFVSYYFYIDYFTTYCKMTLQCPSRIRLYSDTNSIVLIKYVWSISVTIFYMDDALW